MQRLPFPIHRTFAQRLARTLARLACIVGLLALPPGLASCGGGGGGGPSVAPEQIVGTYSLVDFEIRYDTGYVARPWNTGTWYGYLSVGPDGTYYAEWVFDGVPTQDYGNWQQGSGNVALLYSQAYDCVIVLPYSWDAGRLVTVNDHQCGGDSRWTNVWLRND